MGFLVGFGLRDDLLMKLPLFEEGEFRHALSFNFAYANRIVVLSFKSRWLFFPSLN